MTALGSYVLLDEIATGGMATVHLGRLSGAGGFTRIVAIKRLHPQYAKDPEFVAMLLDEGRLASRIRHPNVVPTLDAVAQDGELFLVMEYVEGESFNRLLKRSKKAGAPPPPSIASAVLCSVLRGLHAAHETTGERGESLEIVHRDVSPHNILVGVDGVARLADFGVAKAIGRLQTTREGQLKGKLPYMAPEQIRGRKVARTADIYSIGVVLWESLTAERLFSGDEGQLLERILLGKVPPPSSCVPTVAPELDAIVLRATARDPAARFKTAAEMAAALEKAVAPATQFEVAAWVEATTGPSFKVRAARAASATTSSPSLPKAADAVSITEPVRSIRPPEASLSATVTVTKVRKTRRVRAFVLGLVLAVATVGASAFALLSFDRPARTAPIAPATSSAENTASTVPAFEPSPTETMASTTASTTPSAPPAVPSTSPPIANKPAAPRARPPAHGGTKTRVDCTIPYVVDADGKRTYRRECLPKK